MHAEARSLLKKTTACAMAMLVAGNLMFPSLAFAVVRIDATDLAQGANTVGGGTATLNDTTVDMANVTAYQFYADENVSVNFNGGNDIEQVTVAGSADVDLNFSGENEVSEVAAYDSSDVTINANEGNKFEEVEAYQNSNLTITVTGETTFEEINGYDDANITVRGTDCQKKDTVNIGEGEDDSAIKTERGNLTIDHVTVNVKSKDMAIGSERGNVNINTSKIASDDDNENTTVAAGGTMRVNESVIDIVGTVRSNSTMAINHSDVKVIAPNGSYSAGPYRVWSNTGIELVGQSNGQVKEGEIDGERVFYVDTGSGANVDLKADGTPAYYSCKGDALANTGSTMSKPTTYATARMLPATADSSDVLTQIAALAMSAAAIFGFSAYAGKLRRNPEGFLS